MVANNAGKDEYRDLKNTVHTKLLDDIDLESLRSMKEDVARQHVTEAIRFLLKRDRSPLTFAERETVVTNILDELFGLGPLEPLMMDPSISDILINGPQKVYVERFGKLEPTQVHFDDDAHLMRIIGRIVSPLGRRVDESSPMVDARLPDGSRVNVIIPPLSLQGPVVSIRRFATEPLNADNLIANNTLSANMLKFLQSAVRGKLNVLISGGTGSGKTTLLNVVSAFIPTDERIISIEDAAELQLKQDHVIRLETRPPNIEGKGAVRQRQLVINALRMRPDRIIIGEVRGEEALDMLQAMNTGHEGSLTTIHANSPRDALARLETMVSMANLDLREGTIRQQIGSAINLIIQVSRLSDGSRHIMSISEIAVTDGAGPTVSDLFVFQRQGLDQLNRVTGRFKPTGAVPKCLDRLLAAGIPVPLEIFEDH